MKIGLIQMRSGASMHDNFDAMAELVRNAAGEGARYVQTPEMTNIIERKREVLFQSLAHQHDDEFIAKSCMLARELDIWLHLGSVALLHDNLADKAVNRAILIDPEGTVQCSYDKIHMFDVDLGEGNKWQESAVFEPGREAFVVPVEAMMLGLAICYDLRFAGLAHAQAQAGANVLSYPAAFTRVTGAAHWHALLRARAIENGAFVLAAAQGGTHQDGRETFGHSLVFSPWGRLVAEIEHDNPGFVVAQLDIEEVVTARRSIPNLSHDREFRVKNHVKK